MKKIKFILLGVFFITFSALAQKVNKPSFLEAAAIKIDGQPGDWGKVAPIMKEYGKSGKKSGSFDVKYFHMGYTRDAFFFKAMTPGLSRYKGRTPERILEISFDLDKKKETGNKAANYYRAKNIAGYEFRYILLFNKENKLVGRLLSHKDGFKKPVKEWAKGSFLQNTGSNAEFKIPFSDLGLQASGVQNIRVMYFENANESDSYIVAPHTLNFAAAQGGKSSGKSGGFNIWHLSLVTIWIVSLLCAFAIVPKTGLPTGVAAINLVPFLGQIIFFFILAFKPWPLHEDYADLEARVQEPPE